MSNEDRDKGSGREVSLGNFGRGLTYSPNEVKVYQNQSYPVGELGQEAPAYCNADEIGDFETFEAEEQDDTSFTLLTINGYYLTAEEGGGVGLSTNRRTPGEWERFYQIDGGLRTCRWIFPTFRASLRPSHELCVDRDSVVGNF